MFLSYFVVFPLVHNGPAIKGVCATRLSARHLSRFFRQEAIMVRGGYGVVFEVQVQSMMASTRVAAQI